MSNSLAAGAPGGELLMELSDDELDCVVGGLSRILETGGAPLAAEPGEPQRVRIPALSLQTVPDGGAVLPC